MQIIGRLMNNILIRVLLILLLTIQTAYGKTQLTGNDLQFVGAFTVPKTLSNGYITTYGFGLAVRRVGGQPRLFSTGYSGGEFSLYEMSVPALAQSLPWNTATVTTNYGAVFADRDGWVNGLYWDNTDQRLYYSTSGNYIASGDQYKPSIAYLDSIDSTPVSHGRWGLANRSFKMANSGILAIPSNFADQYLGGKRLAAGFGGYQSNMAFGPISMGPSLSAFLPPTTEPTGGYLTNTPLVGYPLTAWTSGSRPTVDRCWRDEHFINDHQDYIDPDSSFGGSNNSGDILQHRYSGDEVFYWQGYSTNANTRIEYPNNNPTTIATKHWEEDTGFWGHDWVGGGAWIETENKEGIVLAADLSSGRVIYIGSDIYHAGIRHNWLIYNRDQIAAVAQGTVTQDSIQPERYAVRFPELSYTKTTSNDYIGSSTTLINTSSSTVTFQTDSGMAYDIGNSIVGICNSNYDIYFRGYITAYSGTSMSVANLVYGTQSCNDWTILSKNGGAYEQNSIHGIAYDSVDKRLYVAVSYASTPPEVYSATTYTIYVYQVDDTPAQSGKRYRYRSISNN